MTKTTTGYESKRRTLATFTASLLLLASVPLAPTASASGTESYPLPLTLEAEDGAAWAFAFKSDPLMHMPSGNRLTVEFQATGDIQGSSKSIGGIELDEQNPAHDMNHGVVVGSFATPEDRTVVRPLGVDAGNPLAFDWSGGGGYDSPLSGKYGQLLEPDEWRYLLVWGAGAESFEVTVRGVGVSVETVVPGSALSLGNEELLRGGIQVRQGLAPPPGTGHAWDDEASLGAGVSAVFNESFHYQAENPLYGHWTYWDAFKGPCVAGDCAFVGANYGASLYCNHDVEPHTGALPGDACEGLYKLSIQSPGMDEPRVSSHAWMTPGGSDDVPNPSPGEYQFNVDRFIDASGPMYLDPATNTGPHLDETQLWLTFAEMDLTPLASVD